MKSGSLIICILFVIAVLPVMRSNTFSSINNASNAIAASDMFDDVPESSTSDKSSSIFDDKPEPVKNNVNNKGKSAKKTSSVKKKAKKSVKNALPGETAIDVGVEGTKGPVEENLYSFAGVETRKGKVANTLNGKFIILNNTTSNLTSRDNVNFKMVVYWKYWTLMDEPILNAAARWQIRSVYLYDEKTGMSTCYSSVESDRSSEYVPPEILEKVSIVDLRILTDGVIGLSPSALSKGGSFSDLGHFIFDPGIVSSPEVYTGWNENIVGELGYNVAGSPSWNHLILKRNPKVLKDYQEGYDLSLEDYLEITSQEKLYLSEDEAKKFIREAYEKEFSVRFRDIVYVRYNTWPLRQWLSEQNRVVAEKKAVQLKAKKLQELRDIKKNKHKYSDSEYRNEINALNRKYNNNDPLKSVDGEDRQIRQGKEQVRRFLADKRQEIDSRTLPGEKLYAFYDKEKRKYGYKYKDGSKIIIEALYRRAGDFSEGLGAVEKDDKWGFINKEGAMVIPAKYDDARVFSEGLAAVKKDDKWGFINKKGEKVIAFNYGDVRNFSDGMALVISRFTGRSGYVDKNGVLCIDPIYTSGSDFENGKAIVREYISSIDTKYGRREYYYSYEIDKNGKMVSPKKRISEDISEIILHAR